MDGGSIPPGSTIFESMTRIEVPNNTGRRRSGRAGRWFMILLLLIIVGCGLWTWLTLAWAYAEGERAGVLQKFVRRGWVCKTQEGEIALYYGGGHVLGTRHLATVMGLQRARQIRRGAAHQSRGSSRAIALHRASRAFRPIVSPTRATLSTR